MTYQYDAAGRLKGRKQKTNGADLETSYSFVPGAGGGSMMTTPLVSEMNVAGKHYAYAYDDVGNIVSETFDGRSIIEQSDALSGLDGNEERHALCAIEKSGLAAREDPQEEARPATGFDQAGARHTLAVLQKSDLRGSSETLTATPGTCVRGYAYDPLGQLTRVNDEQANRTWTYTYDRGGNITQKQRYAYTTGSLPNVLETIAYTYSDTNWKDKLTAYDGKAITYDAIGNPLTYDGWTYTWKAGRMLHSMAKGSLNTQFTYDHTGLRVKKTVDGVDTFYTYNGKNITHMRKENTQIHFFYDAQGRPSLVRYNGIDYAYMHNLQGDIIGIMDMGGKIVVEYTYDAWGRLLRTEGSLASTLGTDNPFRYRGYVYDEETGLYYLRSRYYNPEWGRWLNADVLLGRIGRTWSHNQFAYCINSPVQFMDPNGTWLSSVIGAIMGAAAAGMGFMRAYVKTEDGPLNIRREPNKNGEVLVQAGKHHPIFVSRPPGSSQEYGFVMYVDPDGKVYFGYAMNRYIYTGGVGTYDPKTICKVDGKAPIIHDLEVHDDRMRKGKHVAPGYGEHNCTYTQHYTQLRYICPDWYPDSHHSFVMDERDRKNHWWCGAITAAED